MPKYSYKFDNTSPTIAPLPCAKCRGPVGLAETNSILIFSAFLEDVSLSINSFLKLLLVIKIFKKPGPAISILSTKSKEKCWMIFSAISVGFAFSIFDNFKHMFEVKSPF